MHTSCSCSHTLRAVILYPHLLVPLDVELPLVFGILPHQLLDDPVDVEESVLLVSGRHLWQHLLGALRVAHTTTEEAIFGALSLGNNGSKDQAFFRVPSTYSIFGRKQTLVIRSLMLFSRLLSTD